MSFEIAPIEESEIEECTILQWTSFNSVPNDIAHTLIPGGFTSAVKTWMHDNMLPLLSDPTVSYVSVRDPNTKALMALARWHFQTEDKSMQALDEADEAVRRERVNQKRINGVNHVAFDNFRDAQAKGRRDILQGKAHAKLGSLVTHPNYRRRGAGAAALNWGLRKADELGLPAYLEATEMGRPLYKKYGFKDVMILPFNAAKHGHPFHVEQWCMLRDASGGNRVRVHNRV